jgi:tRNA(fMet)-specific endonuclease VapC
MTYLLDSNVWVSLLRGTSAAAASRFQIAVTSHSVCICSIVVSELWYGCVRSAKPAANRAAVDALIAPFSSLAYTDASASYFASIRHTLEAIGQVIGPYDMQIAAIALANSCTLVTHNTREFSRIEGLYVEDWELG